MKNIINYKKISTYLFKKIIINLFLVIININYDKNISI